MVVVAAEEATSLLTSSLLGLGRGVMGFAFKAGFMMLLSALIAFPAAEATSNDGTVVKGEYCKF